MVTAGGTAAAEELAGEALLLPHAAMPVATLTAPTTEAILRNIPLSRGSGATQHGKVRPDYAGNGGRVLPTATVYP